MVSLFLSRSVELETYFTDGDSMVLESEMTVPQGKCNDSASEISYPFLLKWKPKMKRKCNQCVQEEFLVPRICMFSGTLS